MKKCPVWNSNPRPCIKLPTFFQLSLKIFTQMCKPGFEHRTFSFSGIARYLEFAYLRLHMIKRKILHTSAYALVWRITIWKNASFSETMNVTYWIHEIYINSWKIIQRIVRINNNLFRFMRNCQTSYVW